MKARAEATGFQSVVRDLGQPWSTVVCSDAIAALIQRQVPGTDCGLNARKVVQCGKVPGSDDPADVCTKEPQRRTHDETCVTSCPEVLGMFVSVRSNS